MKKTALITALLFFIAISGCTASKHYGEYVAAQTEVARLQANEKPMVNISFTDSGGKPITLVVNMPTANVGMAPGDSVSAGRRCLSEAEESRPAAASTFAGGRKVVNTLH